MKKIQRWRWKCYQREQLLCEFSVQLRHNLEQAYKHFSNVVNLIFFLNCRFHHPFPMQYSKLHKNMEIETQLARD